MHVHGAGVPPPRELVGPDGVQEAGAGEGHPGVAGQVVQEVELAPLEGDRLPGQAHLPPPGVDLQVAHHERGRCGGPGAAPFLATRSACHSPGAPAGGAGGHPGPAQVGPDPGQELHHAEGLGDVVVRPHLQPHHAVDLVGQGADQDDGAAQVVAQAPADLEAVRAAGEQDVQQDQVRGAGPGGGDSPRPVLGQTHLEAGPAQVVGQRLAQGPLILHHQDLGPGRRAGRAGRAGEPGEPRTPRSAPRRGAP